MDVILTGNGNLILGRLELPSGPLIVTKVQEMSVPEFVLCAAFSVDGSRIVISRVNGLSVINATDMSLLHKFDQITHSFFVAVCSHDRILGCSLDGYLHIIDLDTYESLFKIQLNPAPGYFMSLSPDGSLVALTEHTVDNVYVYSVHTGELVTTIPNKRSRSVKFNSAGNLIFQTESGYGVWDRVSGRVRLVEISDDYVFIDVSDDGSVAILTDSSPTVRIWDMKRGEISVSRTFSKRTSFTQFIIGESIAINVGADLCIWDILEDTVTVLDGVSDARLLSINRPTDVLL
jgi:WD40 repeat protein